MNLPKFVFEDVPLFLGLISDLFPGLDCPRVRYPSFNDAVEGTLQENNYIVLPNQVILPFKTHSQWSVMIHDKIVNIGGQSGAIVWDHDDQTHDHGRWTNRRREICGYQHTLPITDKVLSTHK